MLISSTSALVLYWTSKEIWKSTNAQEYLEGLDLSEAITLLNMFDDQENYMQTQSLTNRKYFVRKHILEFLTLCKNENKKGEVIILAAGIAPMSVEVASLVPESILFDVDKYSMLEKKKCLNNICPNIKFIECDITDIELLSKELSRNGWDHDNPSLLVMEGIIYYLLETDVKKMLTFFAEKNCRLIADFFLDPAYVNEKNRIFGIEVFRKIKETIGLEFVTSYDPSYFMKMIGRCGIKNAKRFKMDEIQFERTGHKIPFESEESGWISLVKN